MGLRPQVRPLAVRLLVPLGLCACSSVPGEESATPESPAVRASPVRVVQPPHGFVYLETLQACGVHYVNAAAFDQQIGKPVCTTGTDDAVKAGLLDRSAEKPAGISEPELFWMQKG